MQHTIFCRSIPSQEIFLCFTWADDGDDKYAGQPTDVLDDACGSDGDPVPSSGLAEDPSSLSLSEEEVSPHRLASIQQQQPTNMFLPQENLTIPLDFELQQSAVLRGALGIWTRRSLYIGERFGPYLGERTLSLKDPTQGWQVGKQVRQNEQRDNMLTQILLKSHFFHGWPTPSIWANVSRSTLTAVIISSLFCAAKATEKSQTYLASAIVFLFPPISPCSHLALCTTRWLFPFHADVAFNSNYWKHSRWGCALNSIKMKCHKSLFGTQCGHWQITYWSDDRANRR